MLLTVVVALLLTSCGGSLYKVKPVIDLPPLSDAARTASSGGMKVRVAPLLTDEESQNLFEANLPLAGLLPLRVALDYESGIPIELKKARFRLHDADGREWKLLSAKQAIARILAANDVYAYNPSSRKKFEEEFTAYELSLKTPLSVTDTNRQGFLFFQTPGKEPVESPKGLVLQIEHVPQPIQVTVN